MFYVLNIHKKSTDVYKSFVFLVKLLAAQSNFYKKKSHYLTGFYNAYNYIDIGYAYFLFEIAVIK